MASVPFVLDVKEKEIAEAKAPSFPKIKPSTSGFPEHKKRNKVSAFKQKRQGIQLDEQKPKVFLSSSGQPLGSSNHGPTTLSSGQSFLANERINIDRENNQKLASMSPQEIEQARQELFNGLDSSILERLLKRANLDDAANTLPSDQPQPTPETTSSPSGQADPVPEIRIEDKSDKIASSAPISKGPPEPSTTSAISDANSIPHKSDVSVSNEADEHEAQPRHPTNPEDHTPIIINDDDDSAPPIPPKEHIIDATTSPSSQPEGAPAHWPRAPQPADLDPSDPDFLQNLHAKYFPSLAADPSKLAWMAPVPTPHSPADRDSPYYPGQDSLPVSALRFDFRGALLPPRVSRAVPASKGLHHHGEAPEAAGYTVRELARLARSAVPGQRCVAYQTLGRILYRLGGGEFGGVGRDDVSMGIWREFEEGAVLRSLHDEIGAEEGRGRGHRSARAFATEAVWLFEKGGWKDKLKKA
ncbi:RPAP1-like protein [Xylaria sp. FL1777]|nr:RPAP1-like protein [Xylaria sp. FL1777]